MLWAKKFDYDAAEESSSDFLQKLTNEFLQDYRLMKQHELWCPGDTEVCDVDVPLCMYQRFHNWTKDL